MNKTAPNLKFTKEDNASPISIPLIDHELSAQSFNASGPVTIYVGESIIGTEFYQLISNDLKMSFAAASIENDTVSLKNDSIVLGRPEINNITNEMVTSGNLSLNMTGWTPNSYRICNLVYNQTNVIVIAGNDNLGDGYGVYWFIEYFLKLHPEMISDINITRSTNLTMRRMGIGWGYQLHWQDDPPYVNQTNMDLTVNNLETQVKFALKTGMNTFNMGSFLRCLTFDNLTPGDPYVVYANDSPFRLRHEKYVEVYQNFTTYLKQFNFTLTIGTDMFPYTPAIREYLGGDLDVNDPALWVLINESIFELFSKLPFDGLQVRIGEGGEVGAGNYTSGVIFRSIEDTKMLIRNLLSYIDNFNNKFNTSKFLLFRTWSIGIGNVGDLHIDPDVYHQVFDEFDNENRTNLWVSIKHVAMDFFRYIPRNPTIGIGNLPTIVEFQSAREYEGYGNYPNYLASAYQMDLQYFGNSSNFKGVWVWTGYAGWYKGKNVAYQFYGFYSWQDANVYAYSRLNWNYSEDIVEITQDWIISTLGNNSQLIANFTQVLLLSDTAVRLGLYIHDFAKETLSLDTPFFSIGRLPNMLWVYWGIPTSSHAILTAVYDKCRGNVSSNVRDGFTAVTLVNNMIDLASGFTSNVSDPEVYAQMLFSLQYQREVYVMLAWYRQLFLYYYDYVITRNETSRQLYLAALPEVKTAIADYESNWDSYENYSRYETHEMHDFIQRVEVNYPIVQRFSRLFFFVLLGFVITGISMSFYYRKKSKEEESSEKWYFKLLNSAHAFNQSIIKPGKFFENLKEKEFKAYSFFPILLITLIMALTYSFFNYLESFKVVFGGFMIVGLGSWFYFGGSFYVFGRLLGGKSSFLKTLEFTQYLYIPFLIASMVLFGIFGISPEILWYYIIGAILYPTNLIVLLVVFIIILSWMFILGLLLISKNFEISLKRSALILIIPIIILLLILYFILTEYFAELFVFLNEHFDLITSVFNRAETSAAQFF
ncbi:MAG: YIP1 family protein [Candidatus Helarchaeota archaeon]|nr:YIP1 family protein [Candidatus Helarchaeota archaeon]